MRQGGGALDGDYRLLGRHGWRKIAPRPRHPRRMLNCAGRPSAARYAKRSGARLGRGRRVRLMFQDEGRFGLLGTPRRC